VKNNIINSLDDLEIFLESILWEDSSHAGFEEKKKQKVAQSLVKDLQASGSQKEVEEAEEEEAEEVQTTVDKEAEKLEKGELASDVPDVSKKKLKRASLGDITKMLNILRSGRSLKDPEIKGKLQAYLDGLTSSEKETMYVFITGLAEIMVAGESGKEALDPEQAGLKLKVKADVEKTVKNVEKGTTDAPIVVGEVADKSRLRAVMDQLKG
jgi:hypothetical protein